MTDPTREKILALCDEKKPLLDGWCTTSKGLMLAELVERVCPRLIVELGVFGGRSLVPLSLALREVGDDEAMAYGIDPWSREAALEGMNPEDSDDRQHIAWWSQVPLEAVQAKLRRYLDAEHLWDWCALIHGRSECVHRQFEGIDLLHIDGNHTPLCSCRDVRQWVPRVRPGGWICFDDANWPSLQPAQQLMEEEFHCVVDSVHDESPGAFYRLYRHWPDGISDRPPPF